jgi:flavin-binding protein dodecin
VAVYSRRLHAACDPQSSKSRFDENASSEHCELAFPLAGEMKSRRECRGTAAIGGDIALLAYSRQDHLRPCHRTEDDMTESVYKVIELIGTSKESWEKAAKAAVERAGKSLRDLRVAEVVKLDMQLDDKGKVEAYRAKLKVSFKFEK